MKIAISRRAALAMLGALPAACGGETVQDLHIASDGDELAFKPDTLTCRTATQVRLFFHHAGEILSDPHNWVLLKPGTDARFLADADKQPEGSVIPPEDAGLVLAATPLCGKGRTEMIAFQAPAPGDYVFMCSVPGHGATMRGILKVTS